MVYQKPLYISHISDCPTKHFVFNYIVLQYDIFNKYTIYD